jgi:hypothetical protein
MRFARYAVFGLVLLAAACASGGGAGGGESSSSRYLLTAEDLAPHANLNLYEAVSRLRRFWIQGSGGRSPRVFINDRELGGAPSLEEYMTSQVAQIEFVQSSQAMTQYGPDYAGGVIKVTLR